MRGRQLVCIKVHKPKILSLYENPVGYIQGISEEIEIITPRDRTVKNRRYLKSISPNMPSIHKPRGISNSSIARVTLAGAYPFNPKQQLYKQSNSNYTAHIYM